MSFLKVSAGTLINDLYRGLRRLLAQDTGRTNTHDAIAFSVNTQFSEYGYEEDGDTEHKYGPNDVRIRVHLILCGNVHVWVYAGDCDSPLDVPLDEWENISNHDSCWASSIDSFLTHHHFRGCDKVQNHLPTDMRKAPNDVDVHHSMGRFLGQDIFAFLTVEYDPDDSTTAHRFKLTGVKPSEKKLTLG